MEIASSNTLDPIRPAPATATLRDQFAMTAPHEEIMQLLACGEEQELSRVTAARYEWADLMMEARKTPGASTPPVTPKETT